MKKNLTYFGSWLALMMLGCGSSGSSFSSGGFSSSSAPGPISGNAVPGSVVIVRDGRLVRIDSSGQTLLAAQPGALDDEPAYSPDGLRLIFTRSFQGAVDIFRVNLDGSGLTNLTEGFASDSLDPEYSRDGKQIAFAAAAGSGQYELYLMNADGTNLRRLTSGAEDRHPSFSPDGNRLVFERGNKVAQVNVLGGVVSELTDGSLPTYFGSGILFTRAGEVWLRQNGADRQISHTSEAEFQALRAADRDQILSLTTGESVVKGRVQAQSGDFYLMNSDGSNARRLTNQLNASNFAVAPSPPSNKATFTLQIENNSAYPDNQVYLNISGKNEGLTAWYYLANAGDSSLARFDDSPGNLLSKQPNGAFVGNEKYFVTLSDLTAAGNHTYTMEVPRENLYSGRIYLSFGQRLPGVGITAPGYAYAVDGNGAPQGNGTPITSAVTGNGQSDTAGNVISGLNINATTQIYVGEPVSGAGIPVGTVVRSVRAADQIVLSNPGTANAAQTLSFNAPPFSNLSLQGPSFTGAPDYLIPFEFMELSATRDLTIPDPYYTLYTNTSVVDFFSIGLGMSVDFLDGSNKTVGFQQGARASVMSDFNNLPAAQNGFQGFVVSDGNGGGSLSFSQSVPDPNKILRVLGPQNIIQVHPGTTLDNYLQPAIDAAWTLYSSTVLNIPDNLPGHNPYGFTYVGQLIVNNILNMTCTSVAGSQSGLNEQYALNKPTTFIAFKCDDTTPPPNSYANGGTDAHKRLASLLLAAINRGVFNDYLSWSNSKNGQPTFYQRPDRLYNVFAQLLHNYALDGKVYGFGYDDIYGQDPTIAGSIGQTQGGATPPGGSGITRVTVQIPAFARF